MKDAEGTVVDLIEGRPRTDSFARSYQDPFMLHEMLEQAAQAFAEADPPRAHGYLASTDPGLRRLSDLYGEVLDDCRYDLLIVPREVYRPLAHFYGLEELPLTGADGAFREDLLAEASRRIEENEAGAVFYHAAGDDLEAVQRFAARMKVPSFPLDPMDSRPSAGEYAAVALANLRSLRMGLACR